VSPRGQVQHASKVILVPTDFGAAAAQALDAEISGAAQFDAALGPRARNERLRGVSRTWYGT
jgi:hypothetical protein